MLNSFRLSWNRKWSSWKDVYMCGLSKPETLRLRCHQGSRPWYEYTTKLLSCVGSINKLLHEQCHRYVCDSVIDLMGVGRFRHVLAQQSPRSGKSCRQSNTRSWYCLGKEELGKVPSALTWLMPLQVTAPKRSFKTPRTWHTFHRGFVYSFKIGTTPAITCF